MDLDTVLWVWLGLLWHLVVEVVLVAVVVVVVAMTDVSNDDDLD